MPNLKGQSMDLIRDVLDNQLVDKHGRNMGRVDGIVAQVAAGEPPRLVALEVGLPTSLRRLRSRYAESLPRLIRKLGPGVCESYRIAWERVKHVGIDVRLDLIAEETPMLAWELWLREKLIKRLPGLRG